MSIATQQSQTKQEARKPRSLRRVWKVPTSRARWFWLVACILLYGGIVGWYIYTIQTQRFPGPFNDPLRLFGIIAFVLVLGTASYTLRRRFARGLPGKAQNWLWMHTWVGITAILIALLHENFALITHDFIQDLESLTGAYFGGAALIALIILVFSGIIGRLIDVQQTHLIAREASSNGVGIMRALEERILEMEYTVERLSAGKSEPFKLYCLQALGQAGKQGKAANALPALPAHEQADFQRAHETLTERTRLEQSLRRQQRARRTINSWRSLHIVLATLALLVILYHSIMQLLINVFHLLPPV
jgi:hypothetical protein